MGRLRCHLGAHSQAPIIGHLARHRRPKYARVQGSLFFPKVSRGIFGTAFAESAARSLIATGRVASRKKRGSAARGSRTAYVVGGASSTGSFLLHSGTRRSAFHRDWNFYFIITQSRGSGEPGVVRTVSPDEIESPLSRWIGGDRRAQPREPTKFVRRAREASRWELGEGCS